MSDLDVSYDTRLRSFADHTSIDYYVLLSAYVSNHVIMNDSQRTLFDLGWMGRGAQDGVVIDGVEINKPISILESHLPDTYDLLAGTAADEILPPKDHQRGLYPGTAHDRLVLSDFATLCRQRHSSILHPER